MGSACLPRRGPTLAPERRARLGRASLGAGLALLLSGAHDLSGGPGEVGLWPSLGLALGLAWAGRRPAPPWVLLCGALLAALAPGVAWPLALAGAAWASGPALVGAALRPYLGGGVTSAAALAAGAALGFTGAVLLPPPSGSLRAWLAWALVTGICLAGAVRVCPRGRPASTPTLTPSLESAVVGVRVVVSGVAGALTLAFLAPRAWGPAVATTAVGLGLGLGLVAWAPALTRRRIWPGTEALGWALVAVLLSSAPTQTVGLTRAILGLGGLCAGLALGSPLARGGGPGLLASPLGLLLAPTLSVWAAGAWPLDEAAGAALGLGSEPEARAQLGESLERGDVILRLTEPGPPTLQVVDVLEQRLLSRDGRPWAGIPVRRDGDWSYAHPDLLLAAVPLLLGETPLERSRVAAVGLGTGVAAGLCLRAGVAELTAIDGDPAAWAVLRDPGELFGLANGRLLAQDAGWGARLRLLEAPTWAALRSLPRCDVVVLGRPDPDPGLLRLAARRGAIVSARSSPRLGEGPALRGGPAPSLRAWVGAFLEAFPEALALWAGDEPVTLVLIGGVGRLDLARAHDRWAQLEPAVSDVRGPFVSASRLLSTCVADTAGLRRFLEGDQPDDVGGLTAAGADPPPQVVLPAQPDAACRMLVALAQGAAVRHLPASRAWAAGAAELERNAETVRLLGDLIYREGDVDAAVKLWREALALDPSALGPRLSLVSLFLNRGERDAARAVLEDGLEQLPDSPPLHYALGELAAQEDEHLLAARHFDRAGGFRDAPLRVRRALGRVRDVDRRLSLAQQAQAAALLLDRSRTSNDADERLELRRESLELALQASNACAGQEPGLEVRLALARVLEQLAEGEGLALARQNLYRHQASVLAPLGEPSHQLQRGRALTAAGQPELALRILQEVLVAVPGDARALLAKGDALAALGEPESAIEAYQQALASKRASSSDAWVHESLARLHLEAGRPERSLQALEEALELAPDHPRLLRELGELLLSLERRGDALAALRGYLRVAAPEDPARAGVAAQVEALERQLR